MAETLRRLSRPISNIINTTLNRSYIINCSRSLYTEQALDLLDYKHARKNLRNSQGDDFDVFRQTMKITLKNDKNPVTATDLRKMLHLVEKNPEDLSLLKTMLDKYYDNGHDDGTYTFGPTIMRALHYLDEPHAALEGVKNPKFKNLYDQPKTFAILVDLLYENKMYKEVRDVYDYLRHKSVSKLVITVVVMACYKENTPESLHYALKMWKELRDQGSEPLRRVIVTLAALALNQNESEVALELIRHCHKLDAISVRSVKVVALCDLNKLDPIVVDFRYALKHNSHYLADVAPKLDAAVKRLNVQPTSEIRQLFYTLKARRCIHSQTLDEYISTPIDVVKRPKERTQHRDYNQLDRRKSPAWRNDWGLSNRKNHQ